MKKSHLIVLAMMLVVVACVSRKHAKQNPPGTSKVAENLYYDKTEVRNLDYLEYMYWMERMYGNDSEEYKAILPAEVEVKPGLKFPVDYYLNHSAFRQYPIVGISFQQAKDYCAWRTDRVNEFMYIQFNKGVEYHKDSVYTNAPKYVEYRLPTRTEFLAMAAIPFSEKTLKSIQKSGGRKYQCETDYKVVERDSIASYPFAPVHAYWPNEKGIYNLKGNVAEMIAEEGIAMGGSYKDQRHSLELKRETTYTKPEAWLGFRCVCERKIPRDKK